ncbi:MAG: GNAT family N-acetyltransferase [Waterburya sp.]
MEENNLKLETVELRSLDFDLAAVLLAEAFYNNPSHEYIFADPSTRFKSLQWGLKANLKLNLAQPFPIGKSFALVESDQPPGKRQIKAMAFWHPPGHSSPNLMTKVLSGWILAPLKFGRATYQRLSEVMAVIERIKEEVLAQKKAWYLNNMVVDREIRGTRIGTQLLAQQLRSRVIPSGFPAILMTQKEMNVRFYQKLGFKIVHKSIIGTGQNAFVNWCLLFDEI